MEITHMRKENSFKRYFLTVGVKAEGVVGGGFGFYGSEGYTITCTPALGLGRPPELFSATSWYCLGGVWLWYNRKAGVTHMRHEACISQFSQVNSLCVTHQCKVMEDFSWRIVWSLTSLGRTIDGLQTHHLEWSVMGGCWIICFWTLSYGAKSNGFCRCDCVMQNWKRLRQLIIMTYQGRECVFISFSETLVVGGETKCGVDSAAWALQRQPNSWAKKWKVLSLLDSSSCNTVLADWVER